MTKWVTSHLGSLLLVAYTIIVVVPLVGAWWATRELTWATTLPLTALAAPWIWFWYQRNASARQFITGIVATFSSRAVKMSFTARFTLGRDLDYTRIEQNIREFYNASGHATTMRTMQGQGRMTINVDGMPLWFSLDRSSDDCLSDEAMEDRHDLLISVPEFASNLQGTKILVFRRLQLLLDHLQATLDLKMQSVELKVQFERGLNPYLSRYFQNVDLRSITTLRCVLEAHEKGKVTLATDSITFLAADLTILRVLADDHLVTFRAGA